MKQHLEAAGTMSGAMSGANSCSIRVCCFLLLFHEILLTGDSPSHWLGTWRCHQGLLASFSREGSLGLGPWVFWDLNHLQNLPEQSGWLSMWLTSRILPRKQLFHWGTLLLTTMFLVTRWHLLTSLRLISEASSPPRPGELQKQGLDNDGYHTPVARKEPTCSRGGGGLLPGARPPQRPGVLPGIAPTGWSWSCLIPSLAPTLFRNRDKVCFLASSNTSHSTWHLTSTREMMELRMDGQKKEEWETGKRRNWSQFS